MSYCHVLFFDYLHCKSAVSCYGAEGLDRFWINGGGGQLGQTHCLIKHSFCGPLGGATYYHNWPQEVFEE